MITAQTTLISAESMLAKFSDLLGDFRYEDRGIFFSELLFLWAACNTIGQPRQIVESGRARGLSTAILSKLFPASHIVSLEYEADHPDAQFAEAALDGLSNVSLLYGDASVVLPELLLPGDIVLIDGPKGLSAVSLALRALATGRPKAVFIHDCFRGQPARKFLDMKVPSSFCSDDADFVARYRFLDEKIWGDKRQSRQDGRYGTENDQSYGPTLACLPYVPGTDYSILAATAIRLAKSKVYQRLWWRMFGSDR